MSEFLFIKNNYRFARISFSDVRYIQAENNYVAVVSTEKKFPIHLSLNACMRHLESSKFVTVDRPFAINYLDCTTSFNERSAYTGKIKIRTGKNYKPGFLKSFKF